MNAHFAATVIGTSINQSLLLHTNVKPSRDIFFIFISSSGMLSHYFSGEETDGVHSVQWKGREFCHRHCDLQLV